MVNQSLDFEAKTRAVRRRLTLVAYRKRYGEAADCVYAWKQKHGHLELPWNRAYGNIRGRCEKPKASRYCSYGGRGIKCLVTPVDLKNAFMRDKAWLLKWPSVDRIDPAGHYEPSNIRWIEFEVNTKQRLESFPRYAKLIEDLILEINRIAPSDVYATWVRRRIIRAAMNGALSDKS